MTFSTKVEEKKKSLNQWPKQPKAQRILGAPQDLISNLLQNSDCRKKQTNKQIIDHQNTGTE